MLEMINVKLQQCLKTAKIIHAMHIGWCMTLITNVLYKLSTLIP